jgi:hypothetical protein
VSDDPFAPYLRLLRGEITEQEYVRILRDRLCQHKTPRLKARTLHDAWPHLNAALANFGEDITTVMRQFDKRRNHRQDD